MRSHATFPEAEDRRVPRASSRAARAVRGHAPPGCLLHRESRADAGKGAARKPPRARSVVDPRFGVRRRSRLPRNSLGFTPRRPPKNLSSPNVSASGNRLTRNPDGGCRASGEVPRGDASRRVSAKGRPPVFPPVGRDAIGAFSLRRGARTRCLPAGISSGVPE